MPAGAEPRQQRGAHRGDGRLVLLHDPPVPPLNTLFLAHRAGPAAPAVAAVRAALLAGFRAGGHPDP